MVGKPKGALSARISWSAEFKGTVEVLALQPLPCSESMETLFLASRFEQGSGYAGQGMSAHCTLAGIAYVLTNWDENMVSYGVSGGTETESAERSTPCPQTWWSHDPTLMFAPCWSHSIVDEWGASWREAESSKSLLFLGSPRGFHLWEFLWEFGAPCYRNKRHRKHRFPVLSIRLPQYLKRNASSISGEP